MRLPNHQNGADRNIHVSPLLNGAYHDYSYGALKRVPSTGAASVRKHVHGLSIFLCASFASE